MERRLRPVMRSFHLILLATWSVAVAAADADADEIFGTWTTSDLASALSIRGAKCAYGMDDVLLCKGDKLLRVPSDLTVARNTTTLKLEDAGIKILPEGSLTPYAGTLRQLYLVDLPEFDTLAPRIFRNATKLQTIYISNAPKLTHIHKEVFNVYLPRLKELRILRTGLVMLPYLGNLIVRDILDTIDFENNKIRRIHTAWINIRTADLHLSYNEITSVDSMAFNGSEIGTLSLKGNKALTNIHTDAFVGLVTIKSLRALLKIDQLVTEWGSEHIVSCSKDKDPSLDAIMEIRLCVDTGNHQNSYVSPDCHTNLDLSGTSITTLPTNGLRYLGVLRIENTKTLKVFPSRYEFERLVTAHLTYPYHCCAFEFPDKHNPKMHQLVMKAKGRCRPTRTVRRGFREGRSLPGFDGMFHEPVDQPRTEILVGCSPPSYTANNVTCYPEPDAFNPCEDIMGYWVLRIAVWLVAILAILGNFAVLIVLLSLRVDMTVPKFLMCNLALADLCMGFYLTLIAGMDAVSIGEYFNYAIDWQNGLGCQVAGFLTVFSTELSIFALTVITGERWYTITYAIHLNRRLEFKNSARIMVFGWAYACIMAALPLARISGYEATSICLPLVNCDAKDLIYLVILLGFNVLAFVTVVVCYGRMYSSVRSSREEATPMARSDMTVAKKMALLVFTDFACWAPMAFFAVTALAGRPLITVTQTKILLVFVYPLNSCANPYLYALLTHQYRRDLCILLARRGLCKERAAKYKGVIGVGEPPRGRDRATIDRHRSSGYTSTRTSSHPRSENAVPGGIAMNRCDRGAVEEIHITQNGSSQG